MNNKPIWLAAALVATACITALPGVQAGYGNCNNYGFEVNTYVNSSPDCSSHEYYQYCDQGTGAGAGAGSGSGAGSNAAEAEATAGTRCTQNNNSNQTGTDPDPDQPPTEPPASLDILPDIATERVAALFQDVAEGLASAKAIAVSGSVVPAPPPTPTGLAIL